jgi:hypothetical protein
MKIKRILIISLILFSSIPLIAQEETPKLDTIYLLGRKKLIVDVKNVSSSTIRYSKPNSDETVTLERKQIQKIVYNTGRKEVYNKPVMMMVAEGDWKTVIVTDRKGDVSGLYELGAIKAKSSAGSRNAKAAKKSAIIRLQKKAVNLGGIIILLIKEESIGGFGEHPTYQASGIAYGYEPPKPKEEKEEDKK